MIWALCIGVLVSASTPYIEIQLDSLYVGSVNTFNGEVPLNARRVDINNDGFTDLLFPDRVLFQQNGHYVQGEFVQLPNVELSPAVDVFESTVYFRLPKHLRAYRYEEDTWNLVLDVEVEWPESLDTSDSVMARPSVFERFLHDVNSDGVPEVVIPLQDGLHVYGMDADKYIAYPVLDIFPKTKLIPLEDVLPVSNIERGVSYPDQHLVFHCAIEDESVILLTKQSLQDSTVEYVEYRYRLSLVEGRYEATLENEPAIVGPFPAFVQPCRLNPDTQIDFAGGTLDYTSSLALLTPVYSTHVQTMPERGVQLYRTKSFVPHVQFCDVNQDGYSDLMLERTDITHGGLRETLNRFTTQRKFKHHINVHFQQSDGRFSKEADVSLEQTIRLDQTPIRLSEMFERYQAGKLVSFTGDFNGDGMNDCVVQTTPDSLSVIYLDSRGDTVESTLIVPIGAHETFHVLDLNGDSFSDLVFQGIAEHEGESTPSTRVLLFQKVGG